MALSTYAELKSAVASLLNRTDLASAIPDFIALSEADLKRQLRRTVSREQFTVSGGVWAMPAQISELLSIRLVTGSPALDQPIRLGTPEDVAEFRALGGNVSGRPKMAFVAGRDVIFAPSPDQSYLIETTYVRAIVPLSDAAPSNAVLAEAPDVYLYGSALHSAPYLGDDARLGMWRELYEKGVYDLNIKRDREEYGGSLRPMRLPRVFG
jgi:hypothetical protein